MKDNKKKRKGETRDAYLVTDLDPLHMFMTSIMGTRTENEAVSKIEVPMDAIFDCLATLNANNPEFKYTFFHLVCAAVFRTFQERKMMNYFIRNDKIYERKDISVACTVKKAKVDGADEGLVIMRYNRTSDESPLTQIRNSLYKQLTTIRKSSESKDSTIDIISKLNNLPKPLFKLVMGVIKRMDRTGKLPKDLANANPYWASCFISNLGSIKMNAEYHHLINFGSNSFFLIVGEKVKKPVFHDDGSFELKEFLPLAFTIDERIADGVYFANSIKIFKALLLKPEYLLKPATETIDVNALRESVGL